MDNELDDLIPEIVVALIGAAVLIWVTVLAILAW